MTTRSNVVTLGGTKPSPSQEVWVLPVSTSYSWHVRKVWKVIQSMASITSTILWFLLLISISIVYIFDTYVEPIIDASGQRLALDVREGLGEAEFDRWTDHTYYKRHCYPDEITGMTQNDITWNGTNFDKYDDFADMVMLHGAGMIPNIISPDTTAKLRKAVLAMNEAEPMENQFDLKEAANRWALRLNPFDSKLDPERTVQEALRQIASHPTLSKTLEELLGPDPALVEVAAITSAPGAPEQDWHSDTWTDASSLLSGRTYSTMYSFFVYLQDTYADMGSTGFCLGTHMCFTVSDDMECFFLEPMAGSGVLLDSRVWHQGSGNEAYHRPDGTRAMFILTFASRPRPKTDPRLLPLGSVYGIPWYIWGHTLSDLLRLDKVKWNPLHSLGILKSGKNWGWNYLFGSIAAFSENSRNEVLHPEWFLQRQIWTDYERALFIANIVAIVVVTVMGLISFVWPGTEEKSRPSLGTILYRVIGRRILLNVSCILVMQSSFYAYSKTEFAKSINSGSRFRKVPFQNTPPESGLTQEYYASTEVAESSDILFSERLDAYYTFRNTYMYDYHPGNRAFLKLLKEVAMEYFNAPPRTKALFLQTQVLKRLVIPRSNCINVLEWRATVSPREYITCKEVENYPEELCDWMNHEGLTSRYACPAACHAACEERIYSPKRLRDPIERRFLLQNEHGDWIKMKSEEIHETIRIELLATANPALRVLKKELDFILSQCKYNDGGRGHGAWAGVHTAMSKKHTPAFVHLLMELIYKEGEEGRSTTVSASTVLTSWESILTQSQRRSWSLNKVRSLVQPVIR